MQIESSFDQVWEAIASLFSTEEHLPAIKFFKIAVAVFLVVYLFYTFLVLRQVKLMSQFLATNISPIARIITWIYFVYTLFLLLAVIAM